uniref:Secreted protein n=1 Tax=Brugia timori TaxID=42155 RepID=A0A0R3Q8I6_9BILA
LVVLHCCFSIAACRLTTNLCCFSDVIRGTTVDDNSSCSCSCDDSRRRFFLLDVMIGPVSSRLPIIAISEDDDDAAVNSFPESTILSSSPGLPAEAELCGDRFTRVK